MAHIQEKGAKFAVFFGHKDAPSSIYDKLEEAVEKIIAEDGVAEFLVGNQGQFDSMALRALRRMKEKIRTFHIM